MFDNEWAILLVACVAISVLILAVIAIGRAKARLQIRNYEISDLRADVANLRAENADMWAENERLRDEVERLRNGTDKNEPPAPGIVAGHAS